MTDRDPRKDPQRDDAIEILSRERLAEIDERIAKATKGPCIVEPINMAAVEATR